MLIRDAVTQDLPGILAIHNDAIANSVAIWTEELVDLAERAAWLAAHERDGYPVLVAIDETAEAEGGPGHGVLGYASLSSWRTKSGYRHTVEDSIYIRTDATGRGLGRLLLGALLQRARDRRYHVVIADIEAGNAASIHLHEAFGFEVSATLREVGTKHGSWLDLTTMRLQLD